MSCLMLSQHFHCADHNKPPAVKLLSIAVGYVDAEDEQMRFVRA